MSIKEIVNNLSPEERIDHIKLIKECKKREVMLKKLKTKKDLPVLLDHMTIMWCAMDKIYVEYELLIKEVNKAIEKTRLDGVREMPEIETVH